MVPSFSKMTRDELMAFWSRYHRPSRKDAEALIGDRRPGYTNLAADFANLACNMAVVMGCKERGDANGVDVYGHSVRLCEKRITDAGLYLPG